MTLQSKRLIGIVTGITILLMVPLVAMQFTSEVKWTLFDFMVAAVLLFGTGFIIEFVLRKVRSLKNRITICLAILGVLFLVWAELAVGVFGSSVAGS
ncbi:MAG: hypothetical protein ACXVPN_07855 [Bacteroidia bacterium]